MSSPVNSGSIFPYITSVEEKKEDIKEAEGAEGYRSELSVESEVEIKTENELLDSKFRSLIYEYNGSIRLTAGCGARGQHYIDGAWEKLKNFVKEHPEFESQMPSSKYSSREDGGAGGPTGLARFLAD